MQSPVQNSLKQNTFVEKDEKKKDENRLIGQKDPLLSELHPSSQQKILKLLNDPETEV